MPNVSESSMCKLVMRQRKQDKSHTKTLFGNQVKATNKECRRYGDKEQHFHVRYEKVLNTTNQQGEQMWPCAPAQLHVQSMATDPSMPSTFHLLTPLVNSTLPLNIRPCFIRHQPVRKKAGFGASRCNPRTIRILWYIVVRTKVAIEWLKSTGIPT